MKKILPRLAGLNPGLAALLEVCILFLPAIPAYIWMWPNLSGNPQWVVQALVYLYVLAGSVWIGRRRWSWGQLGLNRNGLWLSLACGLTIMMGRTLVILSIHWDLAAPQFGPLILVTQILYYFLLVGFGEELLFRGLIYRAVQDWLGTRWAIWGSSLGFALWHIFGQGPLVGAAMLFYGLVFALIRRRAGGIVGLILVHGLMDISAVLLLPDTDVLSLGRPQIPHPALLWSGLALLAFTPLYLWIIHPRVSRSAQPVRQ